MIKVINLLFLMALYSQNIFLSSGQQLTGDVQIQRSVYKKIGSSASVDWKKYKIDTSQCIFKYNFKQYVEAEYINSFIQIQIYYQYKKIEGEFLFSVKAQKKNIEKYLVEQDKSFFGWKYIQISFDIFVTNKVLELELQLLLNSFSSCDSSEFQNVDYDYGNIRSMTITKITNILCPTKSSSENIYSCQNCLEGYNRVAKNNYCECEDGYYQYKNQLTCQKCNGSCKKCNYNKNKCSECYEHAYLDVNNQCKCYDGYFSNFNQRCEECNSNCVKCQGRSDFCTQCIDDINMKPPFCKCPNGMYFDLNSQKCKFCSYKCLTCTDRPDQCTTCSKGYQLAPLCIKECDQFQELDLKKNECVQLSCDNKCSSCIGKRNNCSTCRGDRQRPPYCLCEQYKYDDLKSENCLTCPLGEFIDVNSGNLQCQKCHFSCKRCTGSLINQCVECYPGDFFLSAQSTCECIEEEMDIINDTKSKVPKCQTMMKMSLKVYINENFQQVFRINFSSPLLKSIQKLDLIEVLQIKLENVSQNEYQIQFFDIVNRNYIEFIILTKKIVPKQKISVLLLSQYVLYGEGQNILSRWYLTNPIQIQMLQDLQDLSNKQQNLLKLKKASESVQNNPFVKFVTQYYFFLFILSTLQPTILFILVSTQLPITLELFLKIIGQFVFNKNKFFAWYELSMEKDNQEYYIFFFDVTEYIKNDKPTNYEIEQLGFMKNFIFNNQIPLLIVTLLCIIYWILSFIDMFKLCSMFQKQKQENQADSESQNLNQTSQSNSKLTSQQYLNYQITDSKDLENDKQKYGQNYKDKRYERVLFNQYQNQTINQYEQFNSQSILQDQKQINETKKQLDIQDQHKIINKEESQIEESKVRKIKQFLQNLIVSNMESNFAIYFISMGMQFTNFQQQNIVNRISIQQLSSQSEEFYDSKDFEYMDNLGLTIIILLIIFNVIYLILFFIKIVYQAVELCKLIPTKKVVNLIVMYKNSNQDDTIFQSEKQNNVKEQLIELQTQTINGESKYKKIQFTSNQNCIIQKYQFKSHGNDQTSVYNIQKASFGGWYSHQINNQQYCFLYSSGQIQFSTLQIHKFYRITFILAYQAKTCYEWVHVFMNDNQLVIKAKYIQYCYQNYATFFQVTTDKYVSSLNNNLFLYIAQTQNQQCFGSPQQQIPSLSDQSYVQQVYYQKIINNFCPEAMDPSNIQNCFSCLNSQNRELQSGQCNCKQGYFQYQQDLVCKVCKQSCLECVNQSECTKCYQNATLQQNQCICNQGYFMNDSFQCQQCNLQCNTCVFSQKYCTSCIDPLQILPSCQCPSKMYFDPSKLSCMSCDPQCQTCQYDSRKVSKNQCTSCAPGFINPPFCQQECTDTQVYDYTQQQCLPMVCENKCQTCSKNSSNCLQCKGDRKDPPYCLCDQLLFEDGISTNCIKCPEGQFLDVNDNSNKNCQPCHYSCKHCNGPKKFDCIDCYSDEFFRKSDGSCACVDDTTTQVMDELNKNKPICMKRLDMNLTIQINQQFKQIFRIEFSDNLIQTTTLEQVTDNLIIYLQNSSPTEYQIFPTFYTAKYIEYAISSQKVIPRQFLYVFAAQQHIFQGVSKTILDLKYLAQPLSVYMIQDEVNSQNNLQNLLQLKKASLSVQDNFFVKFVTKYYFFLFILNTLQPTILFLVVPIELPLNIQLYLKIVGQFVFSKNMFFSQYQDQAIDQQSQSRYYFFNFDLTDDLKNAIPFNEYIYQTGFLNNFFYNTQVPCLLFLIILCLFWILKLIHKFLYSKQKNQLSLGIMMYRELNFQNFGQNQYFDIIEQYNKMKNSNENNSNKFYFKQIIEEKDIAQKIDNTTVLLNNLLLSNLESNFVIYLISIYLQFYNFSESLYINRVSIYVMLVFIFQAIYSQVKAYKYMQKQQFDKIPIFTERINNQNQKYYFHFYSVALKFIIAICAFSSQKTFNLNVSIIILTQILLLAYIFYFRPFKSIIYMIIKILGTIAYLASWICLLTIGIIRSRFDQNNLMTDDDQEVINKLGIAMIVTLSTFNGLYLLSFILDILLILKLLISKYLFRNKKINKIHIIDQQNISIELQNTRNMYATEKQAMPYLTFNQLIFTEVPQHKSCQKELKSPLYFKSNCNSILIRN
ncbi:hypothetical protein ABPG74_004089 [Tetrahymena malaccensis]